MRISPNAATGQLLIGLLTWRGGPLPQPTQPPLLPTHSAAPRRPPLQPAPWPRPPRPPVCHPHPSARLRGEVKRCPTPCVAVRSLRCHAWGGGPFLGPDCWPRLLAGIVANCAAAAPLVVTCVQEAADTETDDRREVVRQAGRTAEGVARRAIAARGSAVCGGRWIHRGGPLWPFSKLFRLGLMKLGRKPGKTRSKTTREATQEAPARRREKGGGLEATR